MWICLKLPHGKQRCFWIPIYYEIPKFPKFPDPGPYHELLVDATILATLDEATKHIGDQGVRRALESGVAAGLKGMQARAGEDFSVSLEAPRQVIQHRMARDYSRAIFVAPTIGSLHWAAMRYGANALWRQRPAPYNAAMNQFDSRKTLSRRVVLQAGVSAAAVLANPIAAFAAAPPGFDQWRDSFRARALAKGISDATWTRVMGRIEPDMSVFKQMQKQPEFNEQIWQYINRRVSDWRIINGREALKKNETLFARIEQDFGVERGTLLALWGVESAYGDPLVQQNHMRPVFPSLAALAWNEPRRRAYWETELINALKIVDRGWSTPEEMRGSWAGAMGHTQWMPEVWLNVGMDYDKDGRVSPFGKPDDALGSSARFLVNRGKYRRGEHWGYEVRAPGASASGNRTYAAWASAGVTRADGQPFPQANASAQLWVPVAGGPAFLLGPNFYAVRSYNPSMNYALAICHLGDRILGAPSFIQPFPGSERALTLAEVQEMQTRLTKAGFDTGGTDGRVGNDTMKAVKDYQTKMGLLPADGYGGLKVLARLRQGG